MKKYILFIALVALASCNKAYKAKDIELNTADDSICYALGVLTGQNLNQLITAENDTAYDGAAEVLKGLSQGVKDTDKYSKYKQIGNQIGAMLKRQNEEGLFGDENLKLDEKIFVQALVNGLQEFDGAPLSSTEADVYMRQTSERIHHQKLLEQYGDVKAEGEAFLAENAKRDEVVVTESGLQYEVIKQGHGPKPMVADRVKVHYHGTLQDGTVFDSSVDRGQPAEFGLMQVIPGWTEVLQLMPVGSTYRVYIPQELAYGEQERMGSPIKPFQMLIFDITLLEILKK